MSDSPATGGLPLDPDVSLARAAVLASGGVESAILTARLLDHFEQVFPVYVRFGLSWEWAEEQNFRRYLDAVAAPGLMPLKILAMPVDDIYGEHWSLSGQDVPAYDTPDEAVFLPGRNLLLLAKTFTWCALNQIPSIAMGHLETNPFPDATAKFFHLLQSAASTALEFDMRVLRPFAQMHKHEVLLRGRDLPLHLSFSCIDPVSTAQHCGRCNKCAERQEAFVKTGLPDKTIYANQSFAETTS